MHQCTRVQRDIRPAPMEEACFNYMLNCMNNPATNNAEGCRAHGEQDRIWNESLKAACSLM